MLLLDHLPALLRVGAVFAVILLGIRKKLTLGNAFLLGGLVLGLLFAMPLPLMLVTVGKSVVFPKTFSLAVIVGLILILSSSMAQTGQMQRMLDAFKGLIASPRLNLVVFPALIGLLPMPGGAVFSAPMVKQLGEKSGLSGSQLSFTNYWFRHIWEYWWPLYPGILLAAALADENLALLVSVMAPLTAASILFGSLVLSRSPLGQTAAGSTKKPSNRPLRPFLAELTPILIVIVPGLIMGLLISRFGGVGTGKEIGLILALIAAIAWVCYTNHLEIFRLLRISANSELLKMLYMIFAILIFKDLLEASGAVEMISHELIMLRIPLVMITIVLPFLVGMITGITIAFVGAAFPILIPLIQSLEPGASLMPFIMLAMTCGFAGVLLSPLHLCLILSNNFFKAGMTSVYRLLWGPCMGLIAVSCLYFWVLQTFFAGKM